MASGTAWPFWDGIPGKLCAHSVPVTNLFRATHKHSAVENYLLPLLALVVILVVDRIVGSVLLAPTLDIFLLAVLAVRLEPKVVTRWFVITSLVTFYSLNDNAGFPAGPDFPPGTVTVRSISFLASGLLAVTMNRYLFSLNENNRHLVDMLHELPCPVVVSDAAGELLFSNRKAAEMLKRNEQELTGESFFSLFTSSERQGNTIQSYIKLTEEEQPREIELALVADREPHRTFHATQFPMDLIGEKCVVTAIDGGVTSKGV